MPFSALVVFDIDGTLFQTQTVTVPAVQETFSRFGLPVPDTGTICAFFGQPVSKYEAWLASLCPLGRSVEIISATNQRELELISETGCLYPGAKESVEALRAAGCVLGICSNGPEAYVARFVEAHGFKELMTIVRARGNQTVSKTRLLGEILAAVPARPLIVVGDRYDDVTSALAHEGLAIGAGYGFGSPEELAGADVVVGEAGDIAGAALSLIVGWRSKRGIL
jgi:phosphoglycolate phosphatase